MKILHDLLAAVRTAAEADQVIVGPFLTAVKAGTSCGLATTLIPPRHQCREPQVNASGDLAGRAVADLARLVLSERRLEACLGLAGLNAALPKEKVRLREQNGLDARRGKTGRGGGNGSGSRRRG